MSSIRYNSKHTLINIDDINDITALLDELDVFGGNISESDFLPILYNWLEDHNYNNLVYLIEHTTQKMKNSITSIIMALKGNPFAVLDIDRNAFDDVEFTEFVLDFIERHPTYGVCEWCGDVWLAHSGHNTTGMKWVVPPISD